jgi:hypothetical protein
LIQTEQKAQATQTKQSKAANKQQAKQQKQNNSFSDMNVDFHLNSSFISEFPH